MPATASPKPFDQEPSPGRRHERQVAVRDLVARIEILAEIAERGVGEGSLHGWNAARAALTAAGRLEMALHGGAPVAMPTMDEDGADNEDDAAAEDEDDGEPPLDDEDWIARFGPRSPES